MGIGEVASRQRPGDRQLTRERNRGRHLSQRPGVSGPSQPHDFETRTLRGKSRPAADGSDNQVWQRDRCVETTVLQGLEACDADRRLGHARRILTGRNKQCREAIGVVTLYADAAAHDAAQRGHPPVIHQAIRCRMQPRGHEGR